MQTGKVYLDMAINSFHAPGFFLYPLKTSENQRGIGLICLKESESIKGIAIAGLFWGKKQNRMGNFSNHFPLKLGYLLLQKFYKNLCVLFKILRIWSHLLKESLMENFIFCALEIRRADVQSSPKIQFEFIFHLVH